MSADPTPENASEKPQIYLITPPEFELSEFSSRLGQVLDAHDVACVRMSMATTDESRLSRAGDILRETCHAREVAIVMESHVLLAEKLGFDGVHLSDANKGLRKLRDTYGPDFILGAHCGTSRHDGLNAGEAGADYISFGPVGETLTGDGSHAESELFKWWSEVVEVPVVAEGVLDEDLIRTLSPITDFFGIGDEIWRHEDPSTALAKLIAAM
ncbi:thiamine phosphate synthase [Halocynthiibacter namhaensis]|uniref:thiamine phosphate synthase n=1 Tax=Halocynthiibacter namhaensis TaxID=1290553 RepID=UPI000578EBEA|nr:thiamine phosphate synthase [Halocynthiibacter namhaensis]